MHEIAEIKTYRDLVAALKERRHALGLSQEQVDDLAGWPDRYLSKVEILPQSDPIAKAIGLPTKLKATKTCGRALGNVSLPIILQVLGLRLVLVDDDEGSGDAKRAA